MTNAAPSSAATFVARLTTGEAAAKRVIDGIAENFDTLAAVAGAAEEAPGRWTVAIHFRDPPNETAVRALVALAADAAAANALAFEHIADADWVAESLAGLAPVVAGRFVIHGAHDRTRVPMNRIGIEIEAALAFGTGHHGTTRGCVLAFDRIARQGRPRNILDLGTGSGVLAIAAAQALRRPVLASDIDPIAVAAARANAQRNRAGRFVTVIRAAGVGGKRIRDRAPFDLVFGNVLLGPLQRFAAPVAKLVTPNARVILSGLLRSQANAALVPYRMQRFALERRIDLDEWTTLVLKRKPMAARNINADHRARRPQA